MAVGKDALIQDKLYPLDHLDAPLAPLAMADGGSPVCFKCETRL